jgi:ornithine carbamoyltransferase
LKLSEDFKNLKRTNTPHKYLQGKNIVLLFEKTSTRTRCSFEVAGNDLGMGVTYLDPNSSQMGKKESLEDTAKVLGRMYDGIEYRGFDQKIVEDLAKYAGVPVWNGLTTDFHPTQMLADVLTIKENFGYYKGLTMVFMGDARNNVANSLLQACAKAGMDVAIASPADYTCPDKYVKQAEEGAKITGSKVLMTTDPYEACKDADVIYADTWTSMGQEEEKAKRVEIFKDYQVNKELMGVADKDAIFLHCLPAYRGYEVTEDIIDGPRSYVFQEAENRLHAHKAILVNCFLND